MKAEIFALEQNQTWSLVPLSQGKKAIGWKWAFKIKHKENRIVERYKLRLVAKEYTQQVGIDFLKTFSPVIHITTIRIVLTLVAQVGWFLHQLDINNAFLYSDLLEEVYMVLPPGFGTSQSNLVCRLQKSLYGLKQASRQWHQKLSSSLLQQGFKNAYSDPSLFIRK
jgi:hypothetical protein